MNCEQIQEQIGAYRDGELDPSMGALVEAELASCETCQVALRELEALEAMVERAVLEPAASVDLTGFTDEVMARIAAEAPQKSPALEQTSESWIDRLASMLGLDARSLAMAGALAAAAIAWGVWPSAQVTAPTPDEQVRAADGASNSASSGSDKATPRPRRGMEFETASAGRNAASVQQVEVAHGRVVIDDNADDPDRPVVVWHIVGEEVDPEADVSP
jgi:anti-sigma factor RsiW